MSKSFAKLQMVLNSLKSDRGATAVEYALVVGGIAVAVLGGIQAFGGGLSTFFTNLLNNLGL